MSRGHPTTTTTRRRRTKFSRLYISLFILSISSQMVSNLYLREIFYIIAHRLVCWTVCPDEHTIHKKIPYGLSIMVTHNSDYRPICRVSTHLVTPNRLCSPHSSQMVHRSELYVVYRTYLDLAAHFCCFVSSQIVRTNQPYAPHRTHNYNLNRVWCIIHRKCFASFLTVFIQQRLRLLHRATSWALRWFSLEEERVMQ